MDQSIISWGRPNISLNLKPTYAQLQASMIDDLKNTINAYTDYNTVTELVDLHGLIDMEVPLSQKYKSSQDMMNAWVKATASKVLTFIRSEVGFVYFVKVKGSRGQGNNKGWLHEAATERKSIGFDKKITSQADNGVHQLKYNNVTVWGDELQQATDVLKDVCHAFARSALYHYLHTHKDANETLFTLYMLGYRAE